MTSKPATPPTSAGLFGLAWPLGLKAMMLHGIIVIDALLVAPLGETALAAMGLAGALAGLLLGVVGAFSNATQIRIAQAFGAAGPVALKTGLVCGLVINFAVVVVGLALVLAFGDRIIDAFAHTEWIGVQAKAYLSVFLWVILGEALGQCMSSHFNGCGNTRVPFYSYMIALPVNVALSFALIHGHFGLPELGVVGAAYGSVAATFARLAFIVMIFWRKDRDILGAKGWAKATFGAALQRHVIFSWPIAGTFVSVSLGSQVCMLIYAKMSVNQFAAMTLILPWVHTAGIFGMAWAQATGIAVAQSLGKQLGEPALDAFLSRAWRGAFIAAGFVSVGYLVICLASPFIYQNLMPETKAAILTFLPVLLLLPFPKGSNAICGQTLRASGDTLYVMNIFVSGQWVFKVPLTVLFVLYLDMPVGWVFAIILGEELFKFAPFHLRLFSGKWKRSQAFAD
jgi:Na+-driven multidrug efflux pump